MDDPERLTAEALQRFATPEQVQAYIAQVERRNRVLDEHERRLLTLEVGIKAVQDELKDMAREAHETRVEQNGLLKSIGSQVETIVREQDREVGRRLGLGEAAAQADKLRADRRSWAQAVLPFLVAAGLFTAGVVGSQFVRGVVAEAQQP